MSYSVYRATIATGAKPLMRRRVTYNGNPLVQANVSTAYYTVYQRSADGSWDAITGHADVELNVSDVISDEYLAWDVDASGFNIEIMLASDLASPFDAWGTIYLVAVTLELVDGVVDGFGWLLRTPSL